jgi:uncharacterized protein (DUF58 family)
LYLSNNVTFFQLPAILIRYKLSLSTLDGKTIDYICGKTFFSNTEETFLAARRGAYFGARDYIIIQDILGFFYQMIALEQDAGERLLVLPSVSENIPVIQRFSGGHSRRGENETKKTDDLTEQRPYFPGDDPRRINWKLLSHAGELFVRQEEREPPPHSQLVLLLDTETDAALYSKDEGPCRVDALCGAALSLVTEWYACGIGIRIGRNGAGIEGGSPPELAALLARPVSLPLAGGDLLPPAQAIPDVHGVLILALARAGQNEKSALNVFIAKRLPTQRITVIFFYEREKEKNYAESQAILFNRMSGVNAAANKF